MIFNLRKKAEMAGADTALPGRSEAIQTADTHFLSGRPLTMDVPEGH